MISAEQFEKLLSAIGTQRSGSFASCNFSYNGKRDGETVETFLTAATVFKKIEKLSDKDALESMPLILREEAATWWNGVKETITTWDELQERVRHAFAPKRPAFLLYQEIVGTKQEENELTEVYISKKRALLAQLPGPAHTETQQIDMIYGQLRYRIREKMPRENVKTFDQLLKAARGVERLLMEKQPSSAVATTENIHGKENEKPKKVRCAFCRMPGHTVDVCRKKQNSDANTAVTSTGSKHTVSATATQVPSPSQPKFSCYGCGAPGIVRSKCPICTKKPAVKEEKAEVSFCSLNVKTDARPRPIVKIGIDSIVGNAYIDSCAKTSVASYELYQCLLKLGYKCEEHKVIVTLADGGRTCRNILMVRVPIHICNHVVFTTMIIFPESRETRTLLGIGFIQDAGMVLNIPQMTWHFVDDPDVIYLLHEEDEEEVSMAHVETTPLSSPALRKFIVDAQPPEFISPMTVTPPTTSDFLKSTEILPHGEGESWSPSSNEPSLPEASACAASNLQATSNMRPTGEPAATKKSLESDNPKPYTASPIDWSPPPNKRNRTLFDGYSPRFIDFMYRDAQMNIHGAEVVLSPHSRNLFPTDDGSDDIEIGSISIEDVTSELLDEAQKTRLMEIIGVNRQAFEGTKEPTSLAEHCINTGEHHPISVPPYRLSPPKLALLKQEIEKMLDEKVIEPCSSPWSAPVVMIPKKDGSVRVCVDYRKLNAITVPDVYPIPRMDDLLHAAKPTPYMTTLDLRAGYWQVKVKEEDQDKTAFITPFGVYRCKRMPFGLRNAPATFQRLIDRVRISLENVKILAYLDDLIIFSTSFEEHLTDLDKVLKKLEEYNLEVNFKKCRFCCSTVKYLGHIITPEGLKVDPGKVAAIHEYPAPNNIKHLVTFLQTCSWFRRFIPNFANLTEPLTRLTRKNSNWKWDDEQEKAFQALKTLLTTAPILRQADENQPYILKTDASNYALGAVLMQGEGQDERPVEFASRLLNSAERNYSTTEREALAVVWAISKFRGYIEGLPITVVTDHQALKWLMSLRSPTGRLARWALQIQAYNITIKYTPGRTNVVADTLSRPICNQETIKTCGICSIIVDMPTRSASEIRVEQLKDENLSSIVKALEEPERTENAIYWSNKGYVMNNGLLYRYNPVDNTEEAQLLVPQHEWSNVLAIYHDDPLAGHYGAEKTYQRISRRYHWKGMRKYIEAYIKNCLPCQRYKPSNLKPAGLLQTTPINQRFEMIAFDLFGPLPPTPCANTWIFIVEDIATGWIELFAMKTASAENCAKVLIDEVFLRYGIPRRLISDNGPQFVSAVMQKLTFCLGITHNLTPVYHPAANPVERKNRDLKTQLAILVEDDHGSWDDKLSSIRFAMNTANSLSTGYTPAYLTFARELRTPYDNVHDLRQIILSENFVPEITPKLLQLADTLKRAREVRENKEEIRKEAVDKRRREDPGYKPGDLVLANSHPVSNSARGSSAKFSPRRDGPYKILKRHGATSYVLADPNVPDQALGVYHTSALTPYRGSEGPLPLPVRPLRKRGRPPKPTTAADIAPALPTRGRGRPKKTTTATLSLGCLLVGTPSHPEGEPVA